MGKTAEDMMEQFLFHAELMAIAKENNEEKLATFLDRHPGQEQVIRQAFLLLQNLKIEEEEVSEQLIEADYQRLRKQTSRTKIRKMYLWIASPAACILLVLFSLWFKKTTSDSSAIRKDVLILLDSMNVDTGSVYLANGQSQVYITDEKTIQQTAEGGIAIHDQDLLQSADIKSDFLQLVVPRGKRTTINFNDGTRVWVNSGTKLIYPKKFASDTRDIFVDGEVYLEVAKDTNRPFFVHTKHIDVRVLGTKFNVNAYSSEEEMSVVLAEGSVDVLAKDAQKSGILKPSQGFFIKNDEVKIHAVDAYAYISWKDNVMKINRQPLHIILNRLSRHYAVKFHVDKDLSNERYTGTLKLNESLDKVLNSLSFSTAFTYVREGDDIYLKF
ncbi:FecR family protein [Sphingobacterium sp. DN00404]|uniref:FecR family protein n=1 Tax=Sphingobacterium micropteri TaxID=2763501 RepID=A0ABR7YIW4_9SPHI|nr:FecR family protein [Sphingobacterium micropteri]MBD1431267.1 FecR family protein [Sphingobacterium micropteri]